MVKFVEAAPAGITTDAGNAIWPPGAVLRLTVIEFVGGVLRVTLAGVEAPSAITAALIDTLSVGPSLSTTINGALTCAPGIAVPSNAMPSALIVIRCEPNARLSSRTLILK